MPKNNDNPNKKSTAVYEKVYGKVYGKNYSQANIIKVKKLYSDPKIYTGGVDVSTWSDLSFEEQEKALKKSWYVYFSYRNPLTGLMERQPPIKAGNEFKTFKERLGVLDSVRVSLLNSLKNGLNPIERDGNKKKEEIVTIEEAFKLVLRIKKSQLEETSYSRYKSRLNGFKRYLEDQGILHKPVTIINKKNVQSFLDQKLENSSPRTIKNERGDISSFFSTLEARDIIEYNFVKDIEILKSKPKRNKSYGSQLLQDLESEIQNTDPNLMLFIRFVSYNFLRPIEVCRLRIEDINIQDKQLVVKAKNKPVKTKTIPDILIKKLPDLSRYNRKDYLFTPSGYPGNWQAKEDSKRDYFTRKFKDIKDHFGLGEEYGVYSFRHTYITQLYKARRGEGYTPHEVKSWLMLITGHETIKALDAYLRSLDVELADEYSEYLKNDLE